MPRPDAPTQGEAYPQAEHDAIVDQLRRQGWERLDAENEADTLMSERIQRRAHPRKEQADD